MLYIDEHGSVRAKKEDPNLLSLTLSKADLPFDIIDSPRDILLPVAVVFYSLIIFCILFSRSDSSKLVNMNKKIVPIFIAATLFIILCAAYLLYASHEYEQDKERLKIHTRLLTLTGCEYAGIALERAVAGISRPDGEDLLRVAEKNFNEECPQGR